MSYLKRVSVSLIIALFILLCVALSSALTIALAQEENSEQLVTPVLEPVLPTTLPTTETQVSQVGTDVTHSGATSGTGKSFLPKGLQNIFQRKPAQSQPAQSQPAQSQPAQSQPVQQQAQQAQQAQQQVQANRREGFQVGNIASDFRLLNIEGQTVQLASLRGSPVILNFWGINCPPCIEELPILQKADREINGRYVGLSGSTNAHFILVSLKSNTEETKEFLDSLGIHMNTLIEATIDQHSVLPYDIHDTETVFRSYRAFGLPTTFIIDPSGVIQSKRIGAFVNEEELSHYLKSVNINWQPM